MSILTDLDKRLPLGMDTCFAVGILGGCGGACPVLAAGRCETQAEMEPELPIDVQDQLATARLALAIARRQT